VFGSVFGLCPAGKLFFKAWGSRLKGITIRHFKLGRKSGYIFSFLGDQSSARCIGAIRGVSGKSGCEDNRLMATNQMNWADFNRVAALTQLLPSISAV